MTLLDTNVIVDAFDESQSNHQWARKQIEKAVATDGGGVSAITLAELCAGTRDPEEVEAEIRRLGLAIHDVPASAASLCGTAYRRYAIARRSSGGGCVP